MAVENIDYRTRSANFFEICSMNKMNYKAFIYKKKNYRRKKNIQDRIIVKN